MVDMSTRRCYTQQVSPDSRRWLADQVHSECQRSNSSQDSSADEARRLRRQVAAYQVGASLSLSWLTLQLFGLCWCKTFTSTHP